MIPVLIAEDEVPERRGLIALLERYYPDRLALCAAAENGREAVRLAREFRPELILMDINMPEMDGLEAAAEIRKITEEAEIVIITAYSRFDYARRAIRLGVTDYMVKPYSIKTLRETLDRALERVSLRREARVRMEVLREENRRSRAREGREGEAEAAEDGSGSTARDRRLCEAVKRHIRSHYARGISLEELSRAVGVSKFHLSRVFRETAGQGIKEFHTGVRIDEAAFLLSQGYSVAEAAYAVGFQDPNYFSRVVKKRTGKTPKELARRN